MKCFFTILLSIALPSASVMAQGRLYARTNLQLATDAEVFWSGPQVGVGIGVKWPSGLGIISEYYGFRDKIDEGGYLWYRQGFFRQKTLALMGSWSFAKTKDKGFYVMAGMAFQTRSSEFKNQYGDSPNNIDFFTPAFEFGRRWPISKNGYGIAASIKFTGPVTYGHEAEIKYFDNPESGIQYPSYVDSYECVEILTQLSIGVVVDRIFPSKKGKKDN